MRERKTIASLPFRMMGVGLVLAVLPGCAAMAVAGLGTSAHYAYNKYSEGELERQYDAPMDRTWNATLKALKDLDIRVMEKVRSRGEIDAQLSDGDTVKVTVAPKTEEITRVKIRVGTFGDRHMSELIWNAIEKRI